MLNLSNRVSVHLVEISPALSQLQAERLCIESRDNKPTVDENNKSSVTHYREGITKNGNVKIYWYYSINDVPRNFSIFIAHEFFDALPIHKFQVLRERSISINMRNVKVILTLQHLISENR